MLKELGLVAILAGMFVTGDTYKLKYVSADDKLPDASSPDDKDKSSGDKRETSHTEPAEPLEERVRLEYVGEHLGQFIGSFDETYVFYNGKQLEFCDNDFNIKKRIQFNSYSEPVLSEDGKFVVSLQNNTPPSRFTVYKLEGETVQEVVTQSAYYIAGVKFTHNNRFLAYISHPETKEATKCNLFLMETRFWQDYQTFTLGPICNESKTHIYFEPDDKKVAIRGDFSVLLDFEHNPSLEMLETINESSSYSSDDNIAINGNYVFGSKYEGDIAKLIAYNTTNPEASKELLQKGDNVRVSVTPSGLLVVGSRSNKTNDSDYVTERLTHLEDKGYKPKTSKPKNSSEKSTIRVYDKDFNIVSVANLDLGIDRLRVSNDEKFIICSQNHGFSDYIPRSIIYRLHPSN